MKPYHWIVSAALAAYACHLAVHHATPIDRALPLLAVAVTVCAAISYREVMLGAPLLIAASIAIGDERTRLLAYGLVLAAAFVVCGVRRPQSPLSLRRPQSPLAIAPLASAQPSAATAVAASHSGDCGRRTPHLTAVAIALLRWIPFEEVLVVRELFLLAICILIVYVLGRTQLGVLIAVSTALITPAIPLRTLAVPVLVLVVAMAARTFGMPRIELRWISTALVACVMLFFAWSGVVARAFPYLLRAAADHAPLHQVDIALAANDSLTLEVPERAKSLVLSGANVAGFRRGTLLGRIEPGAIDVRIGDASDWGAFRLEHAYSARNPLPRNPAGSIHGYGYGAWVDGAGRLPLPPGARTIRITAAALPANASLLVEGFEVE